jgi:hypothetical protein
MNRNASRIGAVNRNLSDRMVRMPGRNIHSPFTLSYGLRVSKVAGA